MRDVKFAEAALADIATIRNFSIERFGEAVADRYVDDLEQMISGLRKHPESAPQWKGADCDFRCKTFRDSVSSTGSMSKASISFAFCIMPAMSAAL